MDYARDFAEAAQRWHETDHGPLRGKPLRRSRFIEPVVEPVVDELPPVPESFRDCALCRPTPQTPFELRERNNPYWFRVVAWESS